jgi:hypothetical protein
MFVAKSCESLKSFQRPKYVFVVTIPFFVVSEKQVLPLDIDVTLVVLK